MKKLLFGVLLMAAMFTRAGDSYLYWMLGDDVSSKYLYDSVKVAAVDSSWNATYLTLYTENFDELGGVVSKGQVDMANDWGAGFLASLGPDSSSYVIELYNGSKAIAHTTTPLSEVQNYIVYKSAMNPGAVSSWTMGSGAFSAGPIPEPTSGMMLLLGMAALALRRRRV